MTRKRPRRTSRGSKRRRLGKIWAIWTVAEKEYFNDGVTQKADLVIGSDDGTYDVAAIEAAIHKSL